jgi:hypothetical protein
MGVTMTKDFRNFGIQILSRVFVAAVIITATSAGAAAQIKITDVSDIGNDLAAPIESIVHVLNNRQCLTPGEKADLLARVAEISNQIESDFRSLETPMAVGSAARSRSGLRVSNYRNRLERLQKEIQDFPVCPSRANTGGYIGVQGLKTWGKSKTEEFLAATGGTTNTFFDKGDPLGVGVVFGYNFAPWNNVIVGPFGSVDWLRMKINHTFPTGFYLGTTTDHIFTAGLKAGYSVAPGLLLYGLAGAAWLNQDLVINFATRSVKNTTTPGFTTGFGGEWQPAALQGFAVPVSIFAQYQHTWYDTAKFDTPAASPAFNYAFKRDDDTIKFGLNVYLSP